MENESDREPSRIVPANDNDDAEEGDAEARIFGTLGAPLAEYMGQLFEQNGATAA